MSQRTDVTWGARSYGKGESDRSSDPHEIRNIQLRPATSAQPLLSVLYFDYESEDHPHPPFPPQVLKDWGKLWIILPVRGPLGHFWEVHPSLKLSSNSAMIDVDEPLA